MNRIIFCAFALAAAACGGTSSGSGGLGGPLSETISENGLGTFAVQKELVPNDAEMQPPPNCVSGEPDARLKPGMVFRSSFRMNTRTEGFFGLLTQQTMNEVSANRLTSILRVMNQKNFGTVQAGKSMEQVCTKTNGTSWSCTVNANIQLPKGLLKYVYCGMSSTTDFKQQHALGTYTTADGKSYEAIYTRTVAHGDVSCSDAGESRGPGVYTMISISTKDMIEPGISYGCRASLSQFSRIETLGRMLFETHSQTDFVR